MFYFRRILPGRPRREVAVSLGTRRYREAEWLAGELSVRFNVAICSAPGTMTDQPTADIAAIIREHLRELLDADLAQRIGTPARQPTFTTKEGAAAMADSEGLSPREADLEVIGLVLADALEALADRDPRAVASEVRQLMAEHRLPEDARSRLTVGLLEARVEMLKVIEARTRGDVPLVLSEKPAPVECITAPVAPTPTPTPAPVEAAPVPLSALVEASFASRRDRDGATFQVINQERATVRWFIEVCGDRPPQAYGRGDITRFLATLRRLPATIGKSPRDKGRPLMEIIKEADEKRSPRLTDKTVKRHLSALSQLFRFAVDAGLLSNTQKGELVEGHRFREGKQARTQRDAWTPEELAKLFATPVWTGCESESRRSSPGTAIIRDAKFWLPILALFHGGRLEEFADLRRRDLQCKDGIWFMDIRETDAAEGQRERRLKTQNATRAIPLHPELQRLGFIAYASRIAPTPDAPLFPDLEPQGPDRKRGPRLTRWFGQYRKTVGVYREDVGMHAFRHAAITRLSNAITTEQQRRHRDFIMGHASGGTEGDIRYDKGAPLPELAATLALLSFPEVNLSHLHVPQGAPQEGR